MLQIDERFKDAAPEETIKRIKSILHQNGISVTETFGNSGLKNCHSLTISIDGTGLAANGKGATETLARASAHAELMERLQSGRLGTGTTVFADSVRFEKEQILEHCSEHLKAIAERNPKSNGEIASVEELAELCLLLGNGETADAVPFYDVMRNEMTFFPIPLTRLYSTTGLAAGNTAEEAIVQGMSEIFERNSKLLIMREQLVPPVIPESYLKQYPGPYETIVAIHEAGYDVSIKDCSAGKPFPVLAAVLINKNTHCYHVHMGSHPVFEIALKRTLTETFQGRTLTNVTTVDKLVSAKDYRATGTEIVRNMTDSTGTYPVEFFGDNYSYEFKPFKNRTDMSNKELLREMVDYLTSIGCRMLVRDHSSLGFPTYRILIPGYSESRPHWIDNGASLLTLQHIYNSFPDKYTDMTSERAGIRISVERSLLKLTGRELFTNSFAPVLAIDAKTNRALYALNIAFLEWAAGNKSNSLEYISNVRKSVPEYDSAFLHCLKNWISFEINGADHKKILSALSHFYDRETVDEVYAAVCGGNPFKKYALDCSENDCPDCKYKDICLNSNRREIKSKINRALEAFDNEAAFAKLISIFDELRKI